MNKAGLIAKIAELSNVPKTTALESLDSVLNAMAETMATGETITLVGFGVFTVKESPERMGRNPKTCEPVLIKAQKKVTFKCGKDLKEKVSK